MPGGVDHSPPGGHDLYSLRIHDLRHTAVALWIAAGAYPKEVAARAGHSSVSFTLDRYGHLYPESDAAKALPWSNCFESDCGSGAAPERGEPRRQWIDT